MITKLIVANGKSAGRAILIKRNTLLIGRAEECDVRPLSEDVSRRHCAVHVGPADVWVEDLGSRNGTFVNGERISGKVKVASGDLLRVGALEVRISCTEPAVAAESDQDVSRWLMADDSPAGMYDTTRSLKPEPSAGSDASSIHHVASAPEPSTDGTGSMVSGIAGGGGTSAGAASTGIGSGSATVAGGSRGDSSRVGSTVGIDALRDSKGKPAGLPANSKKAAENSRDAAAEALKKFFNNR